MSDDFDDPVPISREEFALIEQKCSSLAMQVETLTRENQRLQFEVLALRGGVNRRSSNDLVEGTIKRKKTRVGDGHTNVHHDFNNANMEIADANMAASSNVNSLDHSAANSTATGAAHSSDFGAANLSADGSTINVDNNVNNVSKLKKKIIQAIDTNVFVIRKHLLDAKCTEFSVKQKNLAGPVKITINKESEIPIVKAALLENKTSFHEFKWESKKQKAYIIRGLVGMSEVELIYVKEQLVDLGLPSSISLSMFVTGFMKAQNQKNSLVRMVAPPDFDEKLLNNIKYLSHVAVKFEKFKSKGMIQCKHCQRFGHSSAGCHHVHRCVKCGKNHLRDQCPRTHDKNVKLVCCNCGWQHTANNLSACPFFIQRYGKTNSTSAGSSIPAVKPKKTDFHPATTKPGVSYAEALAPLHSRRDINSDLASKIEQIYQKLSSHDKVLQQLLRNG